MTAQPDPHAVPDESVLRPYRFRPEALHDEAARIRSEARLEQILATPPQRVPQTVDTPRRLPSRRAVATRWAAAPVAAALVVAAGVALPPDGVTLPGGLTVPGLQGPQPAFASWTPEPSPVPPGDLVLAEDACRAVARVDALRRLDAVEQEQAAMEAAEAAAERAAAEAMAGMRAEEAAARAAAQQAAADAAARRAAAENDAIVRTTGDGEGHAVVTTTPQQELVAAEQRGTWPVLVFDGDESRDFCLLEAGDGSQPRVAAFTSIGNPVMAADGSVSRPLVMAMDDAADELDVTSLSFTDEEFVPADGIVLSTSLFTAVADQGGLTLVNGYTGHDVLAVVVHTLDGEQVAATVSDGRFVAWWPTSAAAVGYTLTLRNGTVLQDVQPTRPGRAG